MSVEKTKANKLIFGHNYGFTSQNSGSGIPNNNNKKNVWEEAFTRHRFKANVALFYYLTSQGVVCGSSVCIVPSCNF